MKIFFLAVLIILGGCAHIGYKYLHDYDSVDKDQFEEDLKSCEIKIEGKVPHKTVKESVNNHVSEAHPIDAGDLSVQVGIGAARGMLGNYVAKHQAMRHCLKEMGYDVKWLKP